MVGRLGRPALGPTDPLRAAGAEALLRPARAAGAAAGVTRLADVTRLDRIGLPVWQAVRPLSRALSVHQGKGATDADAKLGALLEAIESDAAERFEGESLKAAWCDLPEERRAPAIADYARCRDRPPSADREERWVKSRHPLTNEALYLPFDLVSLDMTRAIPSPFDRASNGVATGATREEAIVTALHELIERDAVTEWRAKGMVACMESSLDLDSVPFGWFEALRGRIVAAGAALRCYAVRSVTGTPVFACEINDPSKGAAPYRAMQGRGCHPIPQIALFKAVAEAIQGRATYIAGARDDLLPSDYEERPSVTFAFGLPQPPGMEPVPFDAVRPGPRGLDALVAALGAAGYARMGVIDLAQPEGLWVVRAFVCGLGSMRRRRRLP